MSDSDDPKVPAETILAASRALEIIGVILEDDELRGAFSTAPEATFNSARDRSEDLAVRSLEYQAAVPEETRQVLESMDARQLDLLGQFGAALIKDGMYFDVPGVGRCYIK
jgi:hypothetical protein